MAVSVIYEIADVLKIKFAGTIGPQNWPRGLFLWWDEVTFSYVNKTNQQCSIMTKMSVDQQCPLLDDWWLKLLAVILVNSHYLCLDECRFLHTSLIIRCLWKPVVLAWHSIQATFVRLKREQMKNKNMVWIIHDVHFWPWVIQRGHNPWENKGLLCTNTFNDAIHKF